MARRRRYCKPFSPAALARGAAIEHREHPEFSKATTRRIAEDHLCKKGSRAYPRGGFGEAWLKDPRLPDRDTSTDRIYGFKPGSKRVAKQPHRITVLAERYVPAGKNRAAVRLRVFTNRTQTQFWFDASYGQKTPGVPGFSRPDKDGLFYSYRADADSTTSKVKAQGWVDAISKGKAAPIFELAGFVPGRKVPRDFGQFLRKRR